MRQIHFFLILLISPLPMLRAQDAKSPVDKPLAMFDYPRTGDGPGYVYRVSDKDHTPHFVVQLAYPKPAVDSVYLPDRYKEKTRKAGFFFKFLFFKTDSTVKANINKELTYSMKIGKGIREMLDEPTVDSLVKQSKINWKSGYKYYIIQETIATDSIVYTMDKNKGWGAGIDGNIPKVGVLNGSILVYNKDSSQLKQKFPGPYRLYYSVWLITPSGTALVEGRTFKYEKNIEAPPLPQ